MYGEEAPPILRDTLPEALSVIFGGAVVEDSPSTTTPTTDGTIDASDDVQQLVIQIDGLLKDADAALSTGDLGLYQSKVEEATLLIDRLRSLLEESSG